MNPELISILICPHCGGDLRENSGALICSSGHTANIARQGYVSLLGSHSGTHTADSAEMIAARERLLAAGHFAPITDAVAAEVRGAVPEGVVVDLGTGTGHYLAAALESLDVAGVPESHARPGSHGGVPANGGDPGEATAGRGVRAGLGIDNSKYAARRAARCHPGAGAIVADIWDQLPVRSGAAAVVLNVFAPRNGEEIRRILAPGGRLVVVTPTAGHLGELIGPLGMISVDADKERRLGETLGDLAEGLTSRVIEWELELDREALRDLVAMGPSADRLEPAQLESALESLSLPVKVTASVRINTATGREA